MDEGRFIENLKRRRYEVTVFDTGAEAAAYLNEAIDGKTVGFGDSETMLSMGLYDLLSAHNEVRDPMHRPAGRTFRQVARDTLLTDVFLTSLNAMSETGELVNIDGNANRVSAIAYGPKKVLMIVGMNKVCSDVDSAMKRARNVAAPINNQRFNGNNPCTKTGACANCKSPDTICCQFLVTRYSRHQDRIHVILVNEALGF